MADSGDDSRPDWKKSVSRIVSPIVSVRTPTGRVERKLSPWRLAALLLLALSLVSGAVYIFRSRAPADASGDVEPLF